MKPFIVKITLILFLFSLKLYSQEFYVNSYNQYLNAVSKLDITTLTATNVPFCPPTVYIGETYSDIAIDSSNNLYYVTTTGLLYRKKSSDSSCEFLGDFTTIGFINSLTADSGNYIYAAGFGYSKMYRYDISSGTFTVMGDLPITQSPAGDLFFYNNHLFLTTNTGILEINMMNPSQSCQFMSLSIPDAYAAFSIDYGIHSKVYIVSATYPNSTFYEVDMENKIVSGPIGTFNGSINGAASIYNSTSTNSTCTPLATLNVQENTVINFYFNVISPSNTNIICKTNINRREITQVRLFDNSGRIIKDFSNQNTIESLDVSGVTNGTYLLTVSTKNGETYTKKIIIAS
ncbi:T9SS type A sorting domain-containing protein [Chryseobacterium sp. ERMR1:04]|uniref:T9SS type A sorting domain-containing protein n=1 Tax=Chryseobacterium sp. ERMR1:04 TaxID=1705393 RepID=UPI0006C8B743|nr:T9SS type A sorting domain-containing protein [Chryseobacterium sp. ERMR1:04]KPH11098.1 hypothetical protein AMQ68_23050 [Chryseobacterium sp. ERMR1:04]